MQWTGHLSAFPSGLAQVTRGSRCARKELVRFSAPCSFSSAHPALLPCSLVEMDHPGERVDQGRCEEVWRREVESHLREIPLPEPYPGDDQGSLADHEKAGNPLKSGAMGPLVQKLSDFFSFERWTGAAAVRRLLCSSPGVLGWRGDPSSSRYLELLQQLETASDQNQGASSLWL